MIKPDGCCCQNKHHNEHAPLVQGGDGLWWALPYSRATLVGDTAIARDAIPETPVGEAEPGGRAYGVIPKVHLGKRVPKGIVKLEK